MLKALGDETRYAMYRELAGSTAPLSAPDLAERLGLHANTVRLHLERLREAGLVDVEADPPRHRRPAPAPLLPGRRCPGARVRPAGPRPPRRAPRRDGRADRRRGRRRRRHRTGLGHRGRRRAPGPAAAWAPSRPSSPGSASSPRSKPTVPTAAARIEFLHCPFRELAEAYPELVCNLHRGLCEGVVDAGRRGKRRRVRDVVRREPCHVRWVAPSSR